MADMPKHMGVQNSIPIKIDRIMRPIQFIWAFCLFALPLCAQRTKEIYVSPNGSDTHSGTRNKPFKTISRAYKALASDSKKSAPAVIWINDGVYRIGNPILIESTLGNQNLAFRAVKGARPIIKGSVELSDWTLTENGLWITDLPKDIGRFREIFVAGKRAVRARYPDQDYLRVEKVGTDKRTYFSFGEGDFPIPNNINELELAVLHDWSMTRIPIKKIDLENSQIHAADSIGAKVLDFFNLDQWEAHPRYYLENAIEFLDTAYEWYADFPTSKLYLKLPIGLNPSSLTIEVPKAEALLHIKGSEKNPVSHISFEGIAFEHTRWNLPDRTYAGIQACFFDPRDGTEAWKTVPAAISTVWASDIRFKDCRISSLGGSGIWLGTGSSHNIINNCTLTDISGNGIMIGEGQDRSINGKPWWQEAAWQSALGNQILNNRISDCGKQFYGAVGIWGGLTAETVIKNNEIYNLPYTGISIGWMWSPEPTPCRDNLITNNHIHHVMRTLSDGGGIYMLGLQPGSKLTHNLIHDISVNAGSAESNGMFLDEGIKDVLVENNLIYNIAKSPLRFHRAYTNIVRGNYLFPKEGTPGIAYNSTDAENIIKVGNLMMGTDDKDYKATLDAALLKFRSDSQSVED